MVRKGGLEPPRFYPPDPKSGASANSATFALRAASPSLSDSTITGIAESYLLDPILTWPAAPRVQFALCHAPSPLSYSVYAYVPRPQPRSAPTAAPWSRPAAESRPPVNISPLRRVRTSSDAVVQRWTQPLLRMRSWASLRSQVQDLPTRVDRGPTFRVVWDRESNE